MQEISLNILDLAQNAISAGATLIEIEIDEQPQADTLSVRIEDNGCGMGEATLKSVADPFYTTRTTRKVGLGLPLFKMAAEQTGGHFLIDSAKGKGTVVHGVFGLSHIDRMPLGDMTATMVTLITCNPGLDFVYIRRLGEKSFDLDTRQMREILGDVPLGSSEVTAFIKEYLVENELELMGGAANEKP